MMPYPSCSTSSQAWANSLPVLRMLYVDARKKLSASLSLTRMRRMIAGWMRSPEMRMRLRYPRKLYLRHEQVCSLISTANS